MFIEPSKEKMDIWLNDISIKTMLKTPKNLSSPPKKTKRIAWTFDEDNDFINAWKQGS
jgi:hypothetical protein